MAKKIGPKETAMRQQREGAAAGLFDATAFQDDLAKLREKHLTKVNERRAELESQRDAIEAELKEIDRATASITGVSKVIRIGGGGRRSSAEMDQVAKDVVAFIESKKDKGASGREINEKFGKLMPSVKQFVKERTGETIATEGNRAAMRYFSMKG